MGQNARIFYEQNFEPRRLAQRLKGMLVAIPKEVQ
jgi:hypothetical protein